MKKSFFTHIVVMIVAVIAGGLLASYLIGQQRDISKNRELVSNAPLGGFNKFASDVQWMLFINYAGGLEAVNAESAAELYKRLNDILANDPNLEIAYSMGGMMFSVEDPMKSADILMRGANNPNLKNNWQIPLYAGLVLDRYVTDEMDSKRLKKAEDMFRLSASRCTEQAPFILSALIRTRAKRIAQNGTWAGIPVVNPEHAYLCALYDEWRKGNGGEEGDVFSGDSLNITDIKPMLLKAAQEAKASAPGNKDVLATVDKVMQKVLADQHLCGKCLAPYAAGDKFCSQCGVSVVVYGTCPKCNAVVQGKYCAKCGSTVK